MPDTEDVSTLRVDSRMRQECGKNAVFAFLHHPTYILEISNKRNGKYNKFNIQLGKVKG